MTLGIDTVELTYSDRASWIETIWEALHEFRDVNIPEGPPHHDEQWDDICTAMAWITEELGVVDPVVEAQILEEIAELGDEE